MTVKSFILETKNDVMEKYENILIISLFGYWNNLSLVQREATHTGIHVKLPNALYFVRFFLYSLIFSILFGAETC